mmetsp:Transcript_12264/g.31102  ORF Transcript_12264/g.31102 Transcript_12264/m.31102 type:complete len:282 (+) Transcript_12264:120-965(+)
MMVGDHLLLVLVGIHSHEDEVGTTISTAETRRLYPNRVVLQHLFGQRHINAGETCLSFTLAFRLGRFLLIVGHVEIFERTLENTASRETSRGIGRCITEFHNQLKPAFHQLGSLHRLFGLKVDTSRLGTQIQGVCHQGGRLTFSTQTLHIGQRLNMTVGLTQHTDQFVVNTPGLRVLFRAHQLKQLKQTLFRNVQEALVVEHLNQDSKTGCFRIARFQLLFGKRISNIASFSDFAILQKDLNQCTGRFQQGANKHFAILTPASQRQRLHQEVFRIAELTKT